MYLFSDDIAVTIAESDVFVFQCTVKITEVTLLNNTAE